MRRTANRSDEPRTGSACTSGATTKLVVALTGIRSSFVKSCWASVGGVYSFGDIPKNVYNRSSRVKPNGIFIVLGERAERRRSGFAKTGYIRARERFGVRAIGWRSDASRDAVRLARRAPAPGAAGWPLSVRLPIERGASQPGARCIAHTGAGRAPDARGRRLVASSAQQGISGPRIPADGARRSLRYGGAGRRARGAVFRRTRSVGRSETNDRRRFVRRRSDLVGPR